MTAVKTGRIARGNPEDFCLCGDKRTSHLHGRCTVRGCDCKTLRPMRVWRWKEEK